MLKLFLPRREMFNSETNEFTYDGHDVTLTLEHSLVSVARWESKWKEPFLSSKGMTLEQSLDYIKCMTITQNVDASVYRRITDAEMQKVNEYMNDSMTATTFSKEPPGGRNREIITAELIYYWMFKLGIPLECQKWHFNRLMTLIKVCSIKETPPKKMSKSEIYSRNKALNEARRKALHSRG
jgi:hypothetical protein